MTYTKEQKQAVLDFYSIRPNAFWVAESLGVGYAFVRKTIKKAGLKISNKTNKKKGDLTEEQINNIVNDYNSLLEIKDLAKKYKVTVVSIYNILNKTNTQLRGHKNRIFSNEEINNILQDWKNGESLKRITKKYKTYDAPIIELFNQHNIVLEERLNKGSKNNRWNGGRTITKYGYVRIKIYPDNKYYSMVRHGYVLEHRYVMAQHLNRPLEKYETVHHIDGNRQNNNIDNLQLRSNNHGSGQIHKCADCGSRNIVCEELD